MKHPTFGRYNKWRSPSVFESGHRMPEMIQMLSSSSSNIVAFLVRSTHFEFPATLEPLIKSGLMASDQEEIPLPPPASEKTVFFVEEGILHIFRRSKKE